MIASCSGRALLPCRPECSSWWVAGGSYRENLKWHSRKQRLGRALPRQSLPQSRSGALGRFGGGKLLRLQAKKGQNDQNQDGRDWDTSSA